MYLTTLFFALIGTAAAANKGYKGYGGRDGSYGRAPPSYSQKPTKSCSTGSTCDPTSSVFTSTYRTPVYSTVIRTTYAPTVVSTDVESTYYTYETGESGVVQK